MQRLLDYVVENYRELERFCKVDGDVDVAKCVKCHQDSYYPGGQPKYECLNFRKLYVIRYLVSRVKQTSDLIGEHILPDIKSKADLSAISFGGGPGVEAVALMDQLSNCDGKFDLTFDNIDREACWEPIYQGLVWCFAEWVKNIRVNPRFFQIDVTSNFTAGQYDVVFVSWILSEMNNMDRFGVLTKAPDLARSRGYIVITDRPEQALAKEMSSLVEQIQGCNLVNHGTMSEIYCGVHVPDEIRDTFRVQLKCNAAWWVLKKA